MILFVISTFTFKHLEDTKKGSLQRRTNALPTESAEARIDIWRKHGIQGDKYKA